MLILFEGGDGSRETLRFIEDKTALGLFAWDIASGQLRWSTGMYNLFGFVPFSLEPTLALVTEMTHPNDRRTPGFVERAVHEGVPLDREFRIIWRNGRVRWLSTKAEILLDRNGKPERIIGVCSDTTTQHESLTRAEIIDLRRASLIEAIGGVSWVADAEGRVMDVHNWTERRADSGSGLLGQGWAEWVHPEDRERAISAWGQAIRTRKAYKCDYRFRQRDQTYRWSRAQAVPLTDKDGVVIEWVGITHDIDDDISGRGTPEQILYGTQIRGARGLLNWAIRDLAEAAGVSPSTLRRLEEFDGHSQAEPEALFAIKGALEKAGIEFLFSKHAKPGLRPR